MQPSFPDEEVVKRTGEVLNVIRQDEDSPAAMAMQALFAMLYPDAHPYGRPAKGRAATVDRITRSDLVAFQKARFAPSTLVAIIVGDVDHDRAVGAGERIFGAWQAPATDEIALAHPPANRTRQERVIPMMNKAQADIAYGFTTIARSDPGYYAHTLMNNALGQYGIGGRLGDSIRERQGMAYYVFSSFDANVVEGPLVGRRRESGECREGDLRSIDEEIRRMAADGLSPEELGRPQAVSDRPDSRMPRDQRGHRDFSADGGVLRSGSRSRPPRAGAARGGHARGSERRRAAFAGREPGERRGGRTVPAIRWIGLTGGDGGNDRGG